MSAHDWGSIRTGSQAATLLDNALDEAVAGGAQFAEVRLVECEELRHYTVLGSAPDRRTEQDLGISVRVLVDGVWGFASRPLEDEATARHAARAALAMATAASRATTERLVLPAAPAAVGEYVTAVRG